MRLRCLFTTTLIFVLVAASTRAQVNVAAPGESGVGVAAAAGFSADATGMGMQFSGTAGGLVDIGVSLRRESSRGGDGNWVKGLALDIVPLRTRNQSVRWSLGGTLSYEFTTVTYTTFSWDGYTGYTGSASRSVEVLSVGGLMFTDVDVSRKTFLQFVGQVAHASYSGTDQAVTLYSFGTGFVTKQSADGRVGLLASATIPSEGEYWTFGVQVSLFWAQRKPRLE